MVLNKKKASMAEQADAPDLKSVDLKSREGSIPSAGTIRFKDMKVHVCDKVYPANMPYIIPKMFKFCPFCGIAIQKGGEV